MVAKVEMNCLFVGNPGAGKSTLLNCLMLAKDPDVSKDKMFKSGISIGEGLTFQFDQQQVKDVMYMDTPGLEDTLRREQAASAISEALKQEGKYQVVFVVTLEAGRVRPQDVTVINLVLESAKEITRYGVIFNKLTKGLLKEINSDPKNKAKLLVQSSLKTKDEKNKPIPIPLFLRKIEDLEDMNNATASIPELVEFMSMLPKMEIHREQVADIEIDKFEKYSKQLESQLKELKENNAAMAKKMEEDKKEYEARMNQIIEEEKLRHEKELERIEKQNQKQFELMERKEKEYREEIKQMKIDDKAKHEQQLAKMEESNALQREMLMQQQQQQQENHAQMMNDMQRSHQQQLEYLESQQSSGCSIM